jgi:hypothetical protein
MTEAYLRTDEREDLISSLKLVRLSVQQCADDLQYWKWALIGAHSSLQAAIVFHLSFGSDLLVAKPEHAKKWLEAYRENADYPDMHMDYFMELYRKAKAEDVLGFRLLATESQDANVKRLLGFRNDFIHFMPKGWSIELAGLPAICIDSLNIVAALAQGPIQMRWDDDSQKARFSAVLAESIELLEKLGDLYDDA